MYDSRVATAKGGMVLARDVIPMGERDGQDRVGRKECASVCGV